MARAIWKGVIRFGEVEVPVKLYSAVEDRSVHFRLLHEKDGEPIQQHMVNPETGDVVPPDQVRRGFEVEPGVFVILDDEDLARLEPEPSRDIEITRFVPAAEISHQWYERPYFLGPDGDGEEYVALARALGKKGVEGVARWTMRKRPYLGALRARDDYLVLIALRSAEEVVPASALAPPGGRELDAREVAMARQLLSALEGEFDPANFQDEYRERVLALVESKASGQTIELSAPREKEATTRSLSSVLEASLQRLKEEKVA
jgi:DNA end-binding protein Ku